jgi:hypothetical protein
MTSAERTAALLRIADIDARIEEAGKGLHKVGIGQVVALFKERRRLVESLEADAHRQNGAPESPMTSANGSSIPGPPI